MDHKIMSTAYVPLQPPYQIIKYDQDVAMQIGTLIVTIQKGTEAYQIETHSHPVVAYENKEKSELVNNELTNHQFMEGAVWNNVEVKDVTTVCLAGATLTWKQFIDVLDHESFVHRYTTTPDVGIFLPLKKLGVKVLPPEGGEYRVDLETTVQPEEAGVSLQSNRFSPIFVNVSLDEDDDENNVSYNRGELTWRSKACKNEETVFDELIQQLHLYSYVLRELLYDGEIKYLKLTYKTENKQFQNIVERLNNSDYIVNIGVR